MKKVWKGFAAAVSAAAIAATGFIGASTATAVETRPTTTQTTVNLSVNGIGEKIDDPNNPGTKIWDPKLQHTFGVYQLFTGDVQVYTQADVEAWEKENNGKECPFTAGDKVDNTLANVKWGANGTIPQAPVNSEPASVSYTALNEYVIAYNDKQTDNDKKITYPTNADIEKIAVGTAVPQWIQDFISQLATTSETDEGNTARVISGFIKGGEQDTVISGGDAASVTPGYYVLQDETENLQDGDSKSLNIINVAGNVTVTSKSQSATFEKKVMDWNDSNPGKLSDTDKGNVNHENWADSADHDFNDSVPFKLTGTLPANYEQYDTMIYQFSDTLSQGLTIIKNKDGFPAVNVAVYKTSDDGLVKLKDLNVATAKETNDFEIEPWDESLDSNGLPTTDTTFTVSIGTMTGEGEDAKRDLKQTLQSVFDDNEGLTVADIRIVATYNATVNENAKVGHEGNPNTAKLAYSNNPNNGFDGHLSNTPEDKVKVFTYKYNINKTFDVTVKDDDLPEFTLYKFKPTSAPESGDDKRVEVAGKKGEWSLIATEAVIKQQVKDENGQPIENEFEYVVNTFPTIDDGYYRVEETKVPAGFNKAEDQFFKVEAAHQNPADDPLLMSLTVSYYTDATFNTPKKGDDKKDMVVNDQYVLDTDLNQDGNQTHTVAGSFVNTIANKKGSQLPSTGGMGTTVLYVAGAAIVLIAGIGLAVALRRRQA